MTNTVARRIGAAIGLSALVSLAVLLPPRTQARAVPSQSTSSDAEIRGLVEDATGRPVAGATVNVRSIDAAASASQAPAQATTDDKGRWTIGRLPAATYRLQMSWSGGQSFERIVTPRSGVNAFSTRVPATPPRSRRADDSLTGEVLVREMPVDPRGLRRTMPMAFRSETPFDELRIRLGRIARASVVFADLVTAPKGWTATATPDGFVLKGAAVQSIAFRVEITSSELYPGTVQVEAYAAGKRTGRVECQSSLLPLAKNLKAEKVFALPPAVVDGQPFMAAIVDPAFMDGEWLYRPELGASITFVVVDAPGLVAPAAPAPPAPDYRRFAVELAPSGLADAQLRVRLGYRDRFGELLLSVDHMSAFVPAAQFQPAPVTLRACRPRAFAGEQLCACGTIPDAFAVQLSIDGSISAIVVAASPRGVQVLLPPTLTPGLHRLSAGSAAPLPFNVVAIVGSLDQNRLWRGESTDMRLQVLGTTEALDLRVENRTPDIIELEGGLDQMLKTPGGTDNSVRRKVKGILRGNFTIDYTLDLGPCPCR